MAYITAHNITSPLGTTSAANYQAVASGRSALAHHGSETMGVQQDFTASLMAPEVMAQIQSQWPGMTRFQALVAQSVAAALRERAALGAHEPTAEHKTEPKAMVDPDDLLIVSTTKADVALRESVCANTDAIPTPGDSARVVAKALGFRREPLVVCTACTSGLTAIVVGQRMVDMGLCRRAVVCGADEQSRFIVSGFMSLQAMSAIECRPYDIDRQGLNLGEAAATVILERKAPAGLEGKLWQTAHGVVSNDAYQTVAPHKAGLGLAIAIEGALQTTHTGNGAMDGVEQIAQSLGLSFVNAHGTATMFNDQMEAKALQKVGLTKVPMNSLKGYYGHTMGAAGVVETIVSMMAADEGLCLGTRGFAELGVSVPIGVDGNHRAVGGHRFLKTLSGFGGCNVAALFGKGNEDEAEGLTCPSGLRIAHSVSIDPKGAMVDGKPVDIDPTLAQGNGGEILTALYRQRVGDYPKFFKMDHLSKLGFLASELILQAEAEAGGCEEGGVSSRFKERADRAVVFFNRTSSGETDQRYEESIGTGMPSPALFIYTLPNIVTGEVAIRNQYHGETTFCILAQRDSNLMGMVTQATFANPQTTSALVGWVEYESDAQFCASVALVTM